MAKAELCDKESTGPFRKASHAPPNAEGTGMLGSEPRLKYKQEEVEAC